MTKMISLREAGEGFARCIREVETGEEFIVTRDGEPVARIVPIAGRRVLTPAQEAARARALARMRQGWPIGSGSLDRDSLHER